jgi:hypothetical protein
VIIFEEFTHMFDTITLFVYKKNSFFLGELSPYFEIVKRAQKMPFKFYGNIFYKVAPKSP